ncbi:hypothetical protein [Roseomonas elaeocarpi]|uniref:Phage protein n=1 Tax=Roseomonas elaeocarpi TaxID=907779 RepID=A0ABV6JQ69_9PROT
MANSLRAKTSFTAGELAPEMLGRGDTRAFDNGARTLRNVFLQPTGGVTRRPGLRHVAMLPGAARLVAFEFNTEQTYLLVFLDQRMQVFIADAMMAEFAGPWTASMLPQLSWTQSADTLLLLHPDMPMQRITRTSHTDWRVENFAFLREPLHRFAAADVSITPSGTTGTVTVTAGAAVFEAGHLNRPMQIRGKPAVIRAVTSSTTATVELLDTLPSVDATTDWEEAAFGIHGWPVTACFHQDRLVIGGSRDLPNRLWMSCSGDLANFDLGTGLDNEGIEFGLLSDQVNAIRAVFSGRHLQVFTSGAEWMVTGDPLTPSSIQILRQTRVGSPITRTISPVDVDGSTIFVGRSGQSVYEFAYTTVEDAYQAGDLAVTARHLINDPVATAYDEARRLLHAVMADGSLATLTLYRAEEITAWTRQETDGLFRCVAEVEGIVWVTVERGGTLRLERLDPTLCTDAALTGTGAAKLTWAGLDHLAGRNVAVVADGAPVGTYPVTGGAVTLDEAASAVEAGLPFAHVLEPMPAEAAGAPGVTGGPRRLVSATFRLLETKALTVDVGRGLLPVPLRRLDTPLLDAAPPSFTGDVTLRALGWRRDALLPLWRISSDVPLPFTLLSVTTDTRITD